MTANNTNYLESTLIITAIVLVGVIWLLSQVLITLSRSILKKRKSDLASKVLMILVFCSAISSSAWSQSSYIVTGLSTDTNYGGMAALDFYALATVIGLELVVILYLSLMIRRSFRELSGEADAALAKTGEPSKLLSWWHKLDKNWMTKAVDIEKESDILLDHDYDGIKELDNALPPWWKFGFYITIVIGFIYLFNFHVSGSGKSPEQEYAAEIEEGQRLEEIYKSKTKDLVDENNVSLADADGMASGMALFTQNCVACHAADGGGGIGPNLTDDNWIHGGALNDIYKTIKVGYPEKGMQSWQTMFSPVQIKNLTGYVKSLRGKKTANPKAPQGEIWQENATPVTDTTAAAINVK